MHWGIMPNKLHNGFQRLSIRPGLYILM